MELTSRKKAVLRALIEDYIQYAEPVGSKTLVERRGLEFSSATLRHEMVELEAMGYLAQPHISSGRVPSPRGYRLFVDELMECHGLSEAEREAINASMRLKAKELDRFILKAGEFLSLLTQYTVYALTPRINQVRLLRFDMFTAGADTFVIVVVTDVHTVKNKVVYPPFPPVEEALRRLTAVLNGHLAGLVLHDVTPENMQVVARRAGEAGAYVPYVTEFLAELSEEFDNREAFLAGQSHMLGHPEYHDSVKARRLLEYLSDSRELARLAGACADEPVRFVIGPENEAEELRDTSVVTASYHVGEHLQGFIGLVGPIRMDYARLASRLIYFAERLGWLLSGDEEGKSNFRSIKM
ncbi:MAG: heat-inducible transcriptional repressor HrcA [Oscillospiraceae bacterium]|jgi:heat-inducible transcriptional repressor|nr:heat-inducible transcriptional repressor HrcA [Oscillospiraceae bacterium]